MFILIDFNLRNQFAIIKLANFVYFICLLKIIDNAEDIRVKLVNRHGHGAGSIAERINSAHGQCKQRTCHDEKGTRAA